MSEIAILVEGLGKQYRIGASPHRYNALRDKVANAALKPFRVMKSVMNRGGSRGGEDAETLIWALKDVSFEIKCGEVVGVIGRNGAGKSTLLKILCRITDPTTGRAQIYGRMGSLLEVGTGFHPELTGRENILLNGAILGMRKREIERKFDEIVGFAEVEKFIDTPVKHYSSGMHMRLAFAVAAHLDPEILMVDEVLAVGDVAFQRKCLRKMGAVANEGRTVVLVSHQMNQIRRLCGSCVWLEAGRVRSVGRTSEVVSAYESTVMSEEGVKQRREMNGKAGFLGWEIVEPRSANPHALTTFGPMRVRFSVELKYPLDAGFHGIALYSAADRQLMWGHGTLGLRLKAGRHDIEYHIKSLPLKPGAYQWLVTLWDGPNSIDICECAPELLITTEPMNRALDHWTGILNFPFQVTVNGTAVFNEHVSLTEDAASPKWQ